MKKILICLSLLSVLASCKKEEDTPATTYPFSYKFSEINNIGSTKQYTKTSEIPATAHRTLDSLNANFTNETNQEKAEQAGNTLIFLNSHQVTDMTDTMEYVVDGDYYLIGGILPMRKSGNSLLISKYWAYISSSNGSFNHSANVIIGKGENLKDLVQDEMAAGDTASAKSYDLVYNKQ